jgi:hypothetical protein
MWFPAAIETETRGKPSGLLRAKTRDTAALHSVSEQTSQGRHLRSIQLMKAATYLLLATCLISLPNEHPVKWTGRTARTSFV